jgi:hypothetical protein
MIFVEKKKRGARDMYEGLYYIYDVTRTGGCRLKYCNFRGKVLERKYQNGSAVPVAHLKKHPAYEEFVYDSEDEEDVDEVEDAQSESDEVDEKAEWTCVCGKVCVSARGLKRHQGFCKTLLSESKEGDPRRNDELSTDMDGEDDSESDEENEDYEEYDEGSDEAPQNHESKIHYDGSPALTSAVIDYVSQPRRTVDFDSEVRPAKRRMVKAVRQPSPSQSFQISKYAAEDAQGDHYWMVPTETLKQYYSKPSGRKALNERVDELKQNGQRRPILLECIVGCDDLDPNNWSKPTCDRPLSHKEPGKVWYARVWTEHFTLAAAIKLRWTHVMVQCKQSAKFDNEQEHRQALRDGYAECELRFEPTMLRTVNPTDIFMEASYGDDGSVVEEFIMPAVVLR